MLVKLTGEADVTTPALREVLDAEVSRKPRLLLIDMSCLEFIDASALSVILQAYRVLGEDGCVLGLVDPSSPVSRVLHLTGLDQVVPVYASADEAAAALPAQVTTASLPAYRTPRPAKRNGYRVRADGPLRGRPVGLPARPAVSTWRGREPRGPCWRTG
jgi:anti-anti-sigma factor